MGWREVMAGLGEREVLTVSGGFELRGANNRVGALVHGTLQGTDNLGREFTSPHNHGSEENPRGK